jgi:putative ABC transport system permease protein
MEARLSTSVSQRRTEMSVLAVFAVMAGLLAAIGIYGVMSYWVTQRQREIGIRMALGAERQQVVRLVLRQSFVMVAIGLLLGVASAFIATRVLRSLLFEVNPTDPTVFALVALVLAASGSVAAYIPARRATRVDPMVTLRYE